jgi:hypothetical protein
MESIRRMKRRDLKDVLLYVLLTILTCQQSVAQESNSLDYDKTYYIIDYTIGVVGYTSDNGVSAWDVNGKKGGWSDNIRFMVCPSKKDIAYGLLLNNNNSTKKFSTEGVKEKTNIVYAAPQVAYLKRNTSFSGCYGLIGGGVGYTYYRSNNKLTGGESFNITDSSVGANAFVAYGIMISKHLGAQIEANVFYSPLTPSYKNVTVYPMQARGNSSAFAITTQIGVAWYL